MTEGFELLVWERKEEQNESSLLTTQVCRHSDTQRLGLGREPKLAPEGPRPRQREPSDQRKGLEGGSRPWLWDTASQVPLSA